MTFRLASAGRVRYRRCRWSNCRSRLCANDPYVSPLRLYVDKRGIDLPHKQKNSSVLCRGRIFEGRVAAAVYRDNALGLGAPPDYYSRAPECGPGKNELVISNSILDFIFRFGQNPILPTSMVIRCGCKNSGGNSGGLCRRRGHLHPFCSVSLDRKIQRRFPIFLLCQRDLTWSGRRDLNPRPPVPQPLVRDARSACAPITL